VRVQKTKTQTERQRDGCVKSKLTQSDAGIAKAQTQIESHSVELAD